ncbi:MAG: metal-dependent hydrolase [Myxococcota bacterium]
MSESTAPARSISRSISIRHPELDLSRVPRHWNGGDPFATHFMNALSSTFPDGEAFFVKSVMAFRGEIDDPVLQKQVREFAGQEGQHSRLHDAHTKLLLDQGYTGIETQNRVARWFMDLSVRRAPKASLAATAALEHLTAILARRLLTDAERFTGEMDATMGRLWRWHALEEAEHKSVAYDVLMRVAPSHGMRVFMLAQNTVGVLAEVMARACYMLWKDGLLFRAETWKGAWRFLFGEVGFLRGVGRDYWPWYRRDFHPDQLDDTDLLDAWRPRIAAEIA